MTNGDGSDAPNNRCLGTVFYISSLNHRVGYGKLKGPRFNKEVRIVDQRPTKRITDEMEQTLVELHHTFEEKLWTPYHSRDFHQMVIGLTKNELSEIRKLYDITGVSQLNKTKLAEVLVNEIPARIPDKLSILTNEVYALLLRVVKADGFYPAGNSSSLMVSVLRDLGMVFPAIKDDKRILIMPHEVLTVISDEQSKELKRTIKRNTEWVEVVKGTVNLQGALYAPEQYEHLENVMKEPFTGKIKEVLHLVGLYDLDLEQGMFSWLHPALESELSIREAQMERSDIDFYPFTKEQLKLAANPRYVEKTPAVKQLSEFFRILYEMKKEELDETLNMIVGMMRADIKFQFIMDELGESIELPDGEELTMLIDLMMELHNTTRKWILKGHSPVGLREGYQQQKARKGKVLNFKDYRK
ncbi:conserved hypothetical protein [Bacillus sp. 349Y]|nr:conserved hypothetical protein [Bacillus sp. 349Y]